MPKFIEKNVKIWYSVRYRKKIMEEKMKIITNDMEKECWDILSIYEDKEFIKEKILEVKPKIQKTMLDKVAKEINFYIKQAEELYNASNTSIITSPLTLFYSLNNLVKATYLLKFPTKGIKASHGLSINNINNENIKLGEISVHINKYGTFNNLNELLNYDLPDNYDVFIKDLLALVPEISSIYNLIYKEEPNVYLLRKNLDKHYEYKVVLPNNSYDETTNKKFDLLEENSVQITFGTNALGPGCYMYKTLATKNINNIIEMDIYGNSYLALGIELNGKIKKIQQLSIIYIILYTYSMEVRYKSSEWINIINSKEKAIVKKSIDVFKIKMLIGILSLLENDKYEFINKIDDYKEDVNYSKVTDEVLKEIKMRNRRYGKSVLGELV